MRSLLTLIWLVTVTACTTGSGQNVVSGWAVLGQAGKTDCAIWPLRPNDMLLERVIIVPGERHGFLASVLNRESTHVHYWAPFAGEAKLAAADFLNLELGRGAQPLGGSWIDGQAVVVVLRKGSNRASVEVRTIHDNVVRFKADLGDLPVAEAKLIVGPDAFWGLLQLEGGEFRLFRLPGTLKEQQGFKWVDGFSPRERPIILPAANGAAVAVFKVGEAGKAFELHVLDAAGGFGPPIPVDVNAQNQVESWSAKLDGNGLYLAFVDGDSLLGTADLRVGAFDWNGSMLRPRWVKSDSMSDEHATEPVFLRTAKGLEVMVLKWIDEESTIARYFVTGGGLGKPVYSGVFPKGSRIVDGFEEDEDAWLIVRSRGEVQWTFRLCGL